MKKPIRRKLSKTRTSILPQIPRSNMTGKSLLSKLIIKRNATKYLRKLHSLPTIKYTKKDTLNYSSINAFVKSEKAKNDKNNKIRENIIGAIINNKVPQEYFKMSRVWMRLKESIKDFVIRLHNGEIQSMQLIHRAGRKYNYDFELIINKTHHYNLELKFNAKTIADAPQFVSPSKPSQYMSNSYEEFYYDNYLPKLSEFSGLTLPDKKTYIKQINNNNPKCMQEYKALYSQARKDYKTYKGDDIPTNFKQLAIDCYHQSASQFIENTELDIEKLSNYLENTQKDKIYMLYHNGTFKLEIPNMDDYKLVSYIKEPEYYRYAATSVNNTRLEILLRWKNKNGIANPAFQIS